MKEKSKHISLLFSFYDAISAFGKYFEIILMLDKLQILLDKS